MGCMREFDSDSSICPHCGYDQNSTATHSNHLKPGTMVAGRYLIGKALGSGGFGITYIAWDSLIGKAVAIKEYLPGVLPTVFPVRTMLPPTTKTARKNSAQGLPRQSQKATRSRDSTALTALLMFTTALRQTEQYILLWNTLRVKLSSRN